MAKGKTCGKCDRWRELHKFSPMPKGKLGRHTYCKLCRSKENGPKFLLWRKRQLRAKAYGRT